ncbi:MAG TPA: hypothetical protein VJ506_09055 [Candidatus Limnocylindrales bacterium]|nr:hypothetical protein [Candidatus Limnocylindrales bacterium]
MTDDPRHLDDTQAFEDDELDDEELEDEDFEEEPRKAAPTPPGRRPSREPAAVGMGGPRRGGAAATTRATKPHGVAVDPSLRIRDRVSELFVIATLIVFGAILVNALAFGHGGAFITQPTPRPTINVTPGPSASESPSTSPAVSASPASSASPAVSPSAASSPSSSAAPTTGPSSTGAAPSSSP